MVMSKLIRSVVALAKQFHQAPFPTFFACFFTLIVLYLLRL